MITIFLSADAQVTRAQVSSWLKKEDDDGFKELLDIELATFLNGFINEKRGKREGEQPKPESKLTYNIILTKLKIALNLKAEDIIELLNDVKMAISKRELSAFFRKPDHKHYRDVKAQLLRNFFNAVQNKYRTADAPQAKQAKNKQHTSPKTYHSEPRGNSNEARPNASAVYVNPKATQNKAKTTPEKPQSKRKVLKLKPEDIWKNHD